MRPYAAKLAEGLFPANVIAVFALTICMGELSFAKWPA
jgi:hypothetical protein